MQEQKNIMSYESVLPEDFDGVFRFSNASDEDFIGTWGSKEYLFPAGTMTPIMILEHSPLEIQQIRKKFGYDYAVREWFKSKGYQVLANQEGTPGNRTFSGIHQAATYTIKDLEPYIQECLKPLPTGKLLTKQVEKQELEDKLHTKDDGSIMTEPVQKGTSLRKRALEA